MTPDPPDDHTGGALPARYRDPVRIGTGGMGAVYRAHDERLGRPVAVKVQTVDVGDERVFRARFRREATSAARIHHPRVATIYDVGEHRGAPYLVMELVPGGNLQERLAGGRPPLAQALDWISQAAEALDAAHAAGVVHRDVKPANLLLDADDGIKVADFGIARVLEDTAGGLTAAGTVLGTSGYTSPEQAEGRPVGPPGDVYSLAAVAFELVTGERPFAGRTGVAELAAHVNDPVPSARDRRDDLPPGIDAVLARGLAKDPDDRVRDRGRAGRRAAGGGRAGRGAAGHRRAVLARGRLRERAPPRTPLVAAGGDRRGGRARGRGGGRGRGRGGPG